MIGHTKSCDQFVETDGLNNHDVPVDALGNYSKSYQQIFSQKLKRTTGDWKFDYLLGANKVDRYNKASGTIYNFMGREVTNELHWTQKSREHNFLFGVENNSESFEQGGLDEKFAGLTSLVFIGDSFLKNWGLHYGLRGAYHTQFEGVLSPAFGVSKRVGDSRVGLNYQRGFKSPTLYQLYGPDFGNVKVGNTELSPEISDYLELSSKSKASEVSLFYNRIDEFIQYDSNARLYQFIMD